MKAGDRYRSRRQPGDLSDDDLPTYVIVGPAGSGRWVVRSESLGIEVEATEAELDEIAERLFTSTGVVFS